MRLSFAFLSAAVLILGSFVGLTALLGWWMLQPLNPYRTEKEIVVIPKGSSIKSISRTLEEKGFIRSRYAFQFAVWKQGIAKKIQAGSFELSPSMGAFTLAQELTKGTDDVWVTLKEGLRAEEIGQELAKVLPGFSLEDEAFKKECAAYEGYLFPETYLVPNGYDTAQACKLLRRQYGEKVTMKMREDMHNANRTEEEVMTLASIVAREAKTPEDMKKVAGVLWNRLEIGMPLQVDATLQYIKGYDPEKKTWWPTPLAADKQLESPYNTYKNPGLPPGPISNPGLDAVMAATYPADHEYLYYISDLSGATMYFATTYEEHQAYIEKYLR